MEQMLITRLNELEGVLIACRNCSEKRTAGVMPDIGERWKAVAEQWGCGTITAGNHARCRYGLSTGKMRHRASE